MIDLDAIRKQAQQDLLLTCPQGNVNSMLWEHAERVFECALLMSHLPELSNRVIDRDVLAITAFYHDAGWKVQLNEGSIKLGEVMGNILSPIHRTLGAKLVLEQLQGLADKSTLKAAAECISILSDHDMDNLHSQIVAEADHLDEFNILNASIKISKELMGGKSIEAVLDTWENQKRYRYWEKKIKDLFRFESVRQVAIARLAVLEQYIDNIRIHHRNMELRALVE